MLCRKRKQEVEYTQKQYAIFERVLHIAFITTAKEVVNREGGLFLIW